MKNRLNLTFRVCCGTVFASALVAACGPGAESGTVEPETWQRPVQDLTQRSGSDYPRSGSDYQRPSGETSPPRPSGDSDDDDDSPGIDPVPSPGEAGGDGACGACSAAGDCEDACEEFCAELGAQCSGVVGVIASCMGQTEGECVVRFTGCVAMNAAEVAACSPQQ